MPTKTKVDSNCLRFPFPGPQSMNNYLIAVLSVTRLECGTAPSIGFCSCGTIGHGNLQVTSSVQDPGGAKTVAATDACLRTRSLNSGNPMTRRVTRIDLHKHYSVRLQPFYSPLVTMTLPWMTILPSKQTPFIAGCLKLTISNGSMTSWHCTCTRCNCIPPGDLEKETWMHQDTGISQNWEPQE